MSSNDQLPPGWSTEWSAEHQRYMFIENSTGHSQWEHPDQHPDIEGPLPSTPAYAHHPKRRQYAAGQSDAYTGESTPPFNPGLHQQVGGPQFFTPGAPDQYPAHPQQPSQGGYYTQTPNTAVFPHSPAGYEHAHGRQGSVAGDQLSAQFQQMNVSQPSYGQQPHPSYSTNLLATPHDPHNLHRPPPEIRLPAEASVTKSPTSNADPSYKRCTLTAIPTSDSLLKKSKLPFALIVTPFRSVTSSEPPVPVVEDRVIARCRRCRSYINPFVTFIDGGSRWKCVMCNVSNEVPALFDWDDTAKQPADRWKRLELNHAVVDFVAPTEYMVRPPQAVCYVFLVDVGLQARRNGMVGVVARCIADSLDKLPNSDGSTRVAFLAFDDRLHFFHITPTSAEFTVMVVSDVDDVYLPRPTELLVNLEDCRTAVDALLGKFEEIFGETHASGTGSAMGSALQAGLQLIGQIGGKLVVLSSSLPSVGAGALKDREDPKVFGTTKESTLLHPASSFYKSFAIDCSRAHVSVDMFLCGTGYQDVATLSCLPRYTSGQTYFYPLFSSAYHQDVQRLSHELSSVLASPIGLEAVIRIRASRGLRMSSFHGNFFTRSTDLLGLATVPMDTSYTVEVVIEEDLIQPLAVMQVGMLYSSCYGERRIRVITLALPTSSNLQEIFQGVDQVAIAHYLSAKAVERVIASSATLESARDGVTKAVTDILDAYRTTIAGPGSGAGGLVASESLKDLPVLALGLIKSVALRQSASIPSDMRAYAMALLTSLTPQLLVPYLCPNFYSLHDMQEECGTADEDGRVILPVLLPPTSERLARYGLFLLEDGHSIFLWIGRDAVPQLLMDVFDKPSYDQLPPSGKITLSPLDNPFSKRVNAIINYTRMMRRGPYWPQLYLVREDGDLRLRAWVLGMLMLDRADQAASYQQFLVTLREKVYGY